MGSPSFLLFCFLRLFCFPVWWENVDQIWSCWELLKLSTVQVRKAPGICCFPPSPPAFNPFVSEVTGWWCSRQAQWARGRAGSQLRALIGSLFLRLFPAMFGVKTRMLESTNPWLYGAYRKILTLSLHFLNKAVNCDTDSPYTVVSHKVRARRPRFKSWLWPLSSYKH